MTAAVRGRYRIRRAARRAAAVSALLTVNAVTPVPAATPVDQIPAGPLSPTGRFADLGGYRLHYDCEGPADAEFTVLFESGIGGTTRAWENVRSRLGAGLRTCTYDRAGYGWSDPGPGPRDVSELALELKDLVDAANISTPLILVGHSYGGFIIREFAHRWPERVAGFVFVDASLTDTLVAIGDDGGEAPRRHPINSGAIAVGSVDDPGAGGGFLNSRRKAIFAQMSEFQNFEKSARSVAGHGAPPPRPAVVLARADFAATADFERRWLEAQKRFAGSVPGAEFRPVAGAGHNIHEERPELVAAAVADVIERVRRDCAGDAIASFDC